MKRNNTSFINLHDNKNVDHRQSSMQLRNRLVPYFPVVSFLKTSIMTANNIIVDTVMKECLKRKEVEEVDINIDVNVKSGLNSKSKLKIETNICKDNINKLNDKTTMTTKKIKIKINNNKSEHTKIKIFDHFKMNKLANNIIKKNNDILEIKKLIDSFSSYPINTNFAINIGIGSLIKRDLTFSQCSYVQYKIESHVILDDIISIIKIIKCVGLYYLENDMCTIAAKHKSFKCIEWFILNNIYIDKFACEAAIKNNDLNMLKIVSENLGTDSITSLQDYHQFYIIGLLNNSFDCLEYISTKFPITSGTIPDKIIKIDNIDHIKYLHDKKILLNDDSINMACKYGSINTLKFANTKNFKFNKKMLSIANKHGNTECSLFIKSIIDNYSLLCFSEIKDMHVIF
jgi:hypothetical protein